jgi:hypothetical protein
MLAMGLLLAAVLWLLQRRGMMRAATAGVFIVAFLLGIFGGGLMFLRVATQHTAAWDKTNLWVYNPHWLLVAFTMFARGNAALVRLTFRLAVAVGGLAFLGVLLQFVPGFDQGSHAVIALAAPAALVSAWILGRRSHRASHAAA